MNKTKKLIVTALMAAVMCVISPFTIPISGGVGISMGIMIVFLMSYILEFPMGLVSCLVYILIGIIGLPVFQGFQGGIGVILGPTGGFIAGYIFIGFIVGLFVKLGNGKRVFFVIGAIIGLIVCYIMGCLWYMYLMEAGFKVAVMVCVIPYIFFDLLKIGIVCAIGPVLKKNIY